MEMLFAIKLLGLGALTGFAAGLLGIGGGMLLVPLITMLLLADGFAPDMVVKVAIATSLTTILFTSISSVRSHHKRGAVRWPVVKTLAPSIVIGSLIGGQLAGLLSGNVLAAGFAVFVALSATQMLIKRKEGSDRPLPGIVGMSGAGGLIGVVSALVGAGGGFITVPFLSKRGVPIHQAVATSAACGFPIALAGTISYVIAGWGQSLPDSVGFVHIPALVCIAITSVLTAPLGARAAHAMSVAGLKKSFAILLYGLAGYMLYKAFVL